MRSRALALVLSVCMVLCCMGTVLADPVAELRLDEPVSFTVTQQTHISEFWFTAEETGACVFYDVAGGASESHVSVGVLGEDQQVTPIADGISRASFEAQAGATYRLTVDASWTEGAETEYTFLLARPVAVESIQIHGITVEEGFVGDTGEAKLLFAPLGADPGVVWSTSDPEVVTVEGDQGGVTYRLVGPGTATVTATTDDGISAQFQVRVKALDVLELGQVFQYTLDANGGNYRESEHDFAFTAPESGYYALMVSYDQSLEVYHDLRLSTGSMGGLVYGDDVLQFYAEEGQRCILNAEFWGTYDQSVTYDMLVERCVAPTSVLLVPEVTEGYVGGTVNVRAIFDPRNSLPQELTWTSSDPEVGQIGSGPSEYASVQLRAAGTTTITVATADGVTDSFQLTVYDPPEPITLLEGQAGDVMLLGGGSVDISFTPEVTAYYHLISGSDALGAFLYTDSAGGDLYHLEAGVTYQGRVDNYADALVQAQMYILRTEAVMPVAMEITKLPDDTTYLKDSLADMWTYQLLAGLEMEVSWSDGTKTPWRFNEEGPYVGQEYLQWELLEGQEEHLRELRLTCVGVTASCQLTVLDISVIGVELVDPTPLQVVENSCGMDNGDGTWYYSSYLFDMRQVKILFSDGSQQIVLPDQKLYGLYVTYEDSQRDIPWALGQEGSVTFGYGDASVELPVQIVSSPVERIELVQLPRDTFAIGDEAFFTGDPACYFAPADLRAFLDGLVLKIWYLDGTEKTVSLDQMQWMDTVEGAYPCVDGYPLGLFGELLTGNEMILEPCEREGVIEFMGVSQSYTIHLVEQQVEDPPVDPPVDPDVTGPTETDPTTEPTEPSTEPTTQPSQPTTEPTEPSEPTDPTDPTVPSQSESTQQPTQTTGQTQPDPQQEGGGWIWIVVVAVLVVAAGAAVAGVMLWKKKKK